MKKLIFMLFVMLLLFGCIFSPESDFSVKLNVKDAQGHPVKDLNVIFINKTAAQYNWVAKAHTTITFVVDRISFVKLYITDIDGNKITTLIEDELSPNQYYIAWHGKDKNENYVPNGVYYCYMTASENDTMYFSDKILIYLASYEEEHKNGNTDINGKFSTKNRKPFCNLYNLDSLKVVSPQGATIGTKAFSDTTLIYLFDPETEEYQYEYAVIRNKKNVINIIWNPSKLEKDDTVFKNSDIKGNEDKGAPDIFGETKLKGNFPNPFK